MSVDMDALQGITELKPSELIRVALADLRECEASDQYVIDMDVWLTPDMTFDLNNAVYSKATGRCAVCLAGSVIAQTGKIQGPSHANPNDFPGKIANRIMALEELRASRYQGFLTLLDTAGHKTVKEIDEAIWDFAGEVPDYKATDPGPFHQKLHEIADFLETEGM